MNIHILNNSISQLEITSGEPYAAVYISSGKCQMKNVTFLKNIAIPLALFFTYAHFLVTNKFENNIAVCGGGIYLDSYTTVIMYENSKLVFASFISHAHYHMGYRSIDCLFSY